MSAPTLKPISPEDRKRWEQQNLADLLYWADLPFTEKIRVLENMEEVVRAFRKGKLSRTTDEHDEQKW